MSISLVVLICWLILVSPIPSSNPASVAVLSNGLDSTASVALLSNVAGDGTGRYSGDNSLATSASLNFPWGVAIDSSSNILIADYGNNRVRKVTLSTGIISTIAGTGTAGYSGDNGQATAAAMSCPTSISFDSTGNIYISEIGNNVIRRITSAGLIQTFCGTGSQGYNGDNIPCTSALLSRPAVIRHDSSNNLYISEWENYRVRKVGTNSEITTFAGNGHLGYGSAGDGGPATSASFWYASGVYPTASGNVYITDIVNNNVRVVTTTGTITTIAGSTNHQAGSSGDNAAASSALFSSPYDCIADNSGNYLYVSDRDNDSIRKINLVTGIIITAVGTGSYSCAGATGIATSVALCEPMGLAIDSSNNLYIVSNQGHRIQKVNFDGSFTPTTAPSMFPTYSPTTAPTVTPTTIPTTIPSTVPTATPTIIPTIVPTRLPTVTPTFVPTSMPTSVPTSMPTSVPTFVPTSLDIIDLNMLSQPMSNEAVRAKTKFYLGTFIGYFLGIYILLYLYSFYGYGRIQANSLYQSAYKAEVYRMRTSTREYRGVLHDINTNNKLIEAYDAEEKTSSSTFDSSRTFREYLKQQRCNLGCEAILYPKGCTWTVPVIGVRIELPPGHYESFLLYLCHNHPLFSCFYLINGGKLGTHGTRILYIGKDVVMFAGYQFSSMLLQFYGLNKYGLNTFINLFIITPTAISVGNLLVFLYSCPFTESIDFQRRYAKYQSLVLFLGRLAIVPLVALMCISLLLACIFSIGREIPLIILRYFLTVQLFGIFFWITKAILLFNDDYYFRLSLLRTVHVITLGNLCCENIVNQNLVEGKDYTQVISNYGLLVIQRILRREDANKVELIQEGVDKDAEVAMNPLYPTHIDNSNVVRSGSGDDCDEEKQQDAALRLSISNIYTSTEEGIAGSSSTRVPIHTTTETEDQLFKEYQLEISSDASFDDEHLSFEDWKLKRKQFKQGTRGSFVKAFQVFEEREQVHGGVASMVHTMHLVGSAITNPLNNKKKK